jgi:hypothetical protein
MRWVKARARALVFSPISRVLATKGKNKADV